MKRIDAMQAIYDRLQDCIVVTIMGAVAAELQSLGHRPNFFYLQHAMGLASSVGLGIALSKPSQRVVVFDGDGSVLMNLGGLTTLARYRPANLTQVIFDNESLLSVGGFPTATSTGSDLAGIAAAAGVPRTDTVHDLGSFTAAFDAALAAPDLTTLVAKVEAVGPAGFVTDLADRRIDVVDLTIPLGSETQVIVLPPIFAPSPGVSMDVISRYDEKGPGWYWNTITMGEHTGTHFDAPVHWVTGKDLPDNATDTIPASRFVGPGCVIDVSKECAENPDFLLTPEQLQAWEGAHGRIPNGAWVLLRTDWSKRSGAAFINADDSGPHTPGFHQRTSEFLVRERDILGVGVETIGTDAGQAGTFDPPFPNHTIMHGAGKFGLASLCNLDRLPPTGSVVIAAPLKLVNGSGSPLRVLALVTR